MSLTVLHKFDTANLSHSIQSISLAECPKKCNILLLIIDSFIQLNDDLLQSIH